VIWCGAVRQPFLGFLAGVFISGTHATALADDVDSRKEYIVNGEPADATDALGTVALIFVSEDEEIDDVSLITLPYRLSCSGTLITPTTVLTAGHCVQACANSDTGTDCHCGPNGCEPIPAHSVMVAAGLTDTDSVWTTELDRVSKIVLHEGYTYWEYWDLECDATPCTGLATNANDLALLYLESPITTAAPVPVLAPSRIETLGGTTTGVAQGYGLKLPPEVEELLPQETYRSFLNQGESPIELTTDNELLTKINDGDGAVCYGDSGGPLYVSDGGRARLVGVASRLRYDSPSACSGGGIYMLAPAYIDWIYENATGLPPPILRGGGGCSAVSSRPTPAPLIGVSGLILLLLLRRRRAYWIAAGAFIAASSIGACGAEDASLCTAQYDPLGLYCDHPDWLDLQTAEALARLEVPDDAWLWGVSSRSCCAVDPDGRAVSWSFGYYLPGRQDLPNAELLNVQVLGSQVFVTEGGVREIWCIPTEPLEPVDSRRLIHDTIRLLEDRGYPVRLGETGVLNVDQHHDCASDKRFSNYVTFGDQAAYFDAAGEVLGLVPRDSAFLL